MDFTYRSAFAWSTFASFFALGCSSSGGFGADARFPTASEVSDIAARPPPTRMADVPQKDVETWDLKDPPEKPAGGQHVATTPWERLLADAATTRQGLLWASEPMTCLARQAGLFVLAEGGVPNEELTRFMAARCGATEGAISFAHLTGDGLTNADDNQFFTWGRAGTEQLIAKHLTSGNLTAGIWAGRDKGKAVVMVAHAPRRVQLDRVPVGLEASGHVVISGEVLV